MIDLNPGGSSADPFPFLGPCAMPGVQLVALDDGSRGRELWRTDGTAAGTQLVVELVPGPGDANPRFGNGDATECVFVADRGQGPEMWRSDGTAAGTRMLFSAAAISASALGYARLEARIGNRWLFEADDQMWLTDGTASGTVALGIGLGNMVAVAGGAFWVAEFGAGLTHAITPTSPPTITTYARSTLTMVRGEPVLSVITSPPLQPLLTTLVAINLPGQPSVANLPGLVYPYPLGDGVFFADFSGRLYRWDLVNPPVLLTASALNSLSMQPLGERLLFTGLDAATGMEPWITDGTPAGTRPLDLTPGPADSDFFFAFAGFPPGGQRALFWRRTPATGLEPWATDGTVAGTVQLADLEPGPADTILDRVGVYAGQRRMLLPVSTSAGGLELWLTDGTPAGSRLLQQIVPGPGDGVTRSMWQPVVAGHRLLFTADDGVRGRELWAVDLEGSTTLLHRQGARGFAVRGDAVFGASIEFASNGLQPLDYGAVAIGLPAGAAPLGLGGTLLLVDLASALPLLPIVPGPGGGWSQSVTLPNLPALAGLDLVAQGAFAGPSIGAGVGLGSAWWLGLGN